MWIKLLIERFKKKPERQSAMSIILENICTFCSQGRIEIIPQITTSIKFITYTMDPSRVHAYTTFDPGRYEPIILVRGWHENVF